MTDTLNQQETDDRPMAWGAPSVAPDPRETEFDTGRPRLGGFDVPIEFTELQTQVLDAAADELIPPGAGFPAPSQVGVVEFIARYVSPDDIEPQHYPYAKETEFKAQLDALGQAFVSADSADRVETLKRLESAADGKELPDDFFTQLLNLVYYGYYSRPEVTLAVKAQIPAAHDYHGPPQPYGYLRVIESWDTDEATFNTRGNGSHIKTEDVKRIDLSKIGWINDRQ